MMEYVAAYINKTIPIPHIIKMDPKYQVLEDQAVTAGGSTRSDVFGVSTGYTIEAEYLSHTEFEAIRAYLYTEMGGLPVLFWCDDLAGTAANNSVMAIIRITEAPRVGFQRGSTPYESNGHHLTLDVKLQ
jgi:hypothetical protein